MYETERLRPFRQYFWNCCIHIAKIIWGEKMLKKTTLKLSASIFGYSIVGFLLTFFIVVTFGSIGATKETTTASSSSASSASSQISSSSASASSQTKINGITYSKGGVIESPAGRSILGIICVMISEGLLYSVAWREGNRDPNRVKYGHMNKFMLKGLIAGFIAMIPDFILTIAFLMSALFATIPAAVINAVYRVVNLQFVIFSDKYLGYPLACIALLLVVPVFTCIGYITGWHNFALLPRIVYKSKKNQKQKNIGKK